MQNKILYFSLLLLLIITGCANERVPTGGPKDIEPPKVLKAEPKDMATNFSGDKIIITFDEYIKLNNVSQKLIISPDIAKMPEINEKGKKIIISFKEELQPNTTYTLFFDDAIVDYNEGNALKDFSYTFSTGSYIDSLSINGKVIDAYTNKPIAGIMVLLYDNLSDTAFLTQKPIYATVTKDNGTFIFNNLKDATYNIYALEDMNNNRYYDLITEKIAFFDRPINASDSMSIILKAFIQEDSIIKVMDSKVTHSNASTIVFDRPLTDISVKFVKNIPDDHITKLNDIGDTLTIYTKGIDTAYIKLYEASQYIDSIRLIVNDDKLDKKTRLEFNIPKSVYIEDPLIIKTNSPIDKVPVDSILLINKTDSIYDSVYKHFGLRKNGLEIAFNHHYEINQTYSIILHDSIVKDITGKYNQRTEQSFSVFGNEVYGSLVLKVKTKRDTLDNNNKISVESFPTNNYILRITNKEGTSILKEKNIILNNNDSTELVFDKLREGDYYIVVVYDSDNNGTWTSGNYHKKVHPERVENIRLVHVKPKWTIEEEVLIPIE